MKRICVCLVDRANYGRLAPIMAALEEHPQFDLLTLVGGSMVLRRFGLPVEELPHRVDSCIFCSVEGSMGRSIGLATQEFTKELGRLRPDYCIVIGDRFECLGAATAAACLRIPLIHFQGGEVSGCLDNKWRHAITQMADYHVPATNAAASVVACCNPPAMMCSYQKYVVGNTKLDNMAAIVSSPELNRHVDDAAALNLAIGCPSSDLAAQIEYSEKPHGPLLVAFHPDTATADDHAAQMDEILEAVEQFQCEIMWPNIDQGSDRISKEIRRWQHDNHADFRTIINLPPQEYLQKLADATCCVGNSSSFVRDAGYFGTPVVLVGSRQQGRECGENVLRVDADSQQIKKAISEQLRHGRYEPSSLYGDGHVTERFIRALEALEVTDATDVIDTSEEPEPETTREEFFGNIWKAAGEMDG